MALPVLKNVSWRKQPKNLNSGLLKEGADEPRVISAVELKSLEPNESIRFGDF